MNFDFNKKDETIIDESKILEKKKVKSSIPSIPKLINIKIGFARMPKGFWAVLTAAASLYCLNAHVDGAGWGLFIAFLLLDKRDGLIPFVLTAMGLAGMYHHIEYSGVLLFFALFL